MSTREFASPDANQENAQPEIETESPAAAGDPRMRAALLRRVQRKALPGGAEGLDDKTRGEMEGKIGRGQNFDDVRVHADSPQAGASHAVAKGNEIHFGPGHYQPGTQQGNWLIAHELTHVVQQRQAGAGPAQQHFDPEGARGSLEEEADRSASKVSAGQHADVELGAAPGMEQHAEAAQAQGGAQGSEAGHAPEVKNQSYAHGGFYGAAVEMLKDGLWRNILQALMPAAFDKVKDEDKSGEAMREMENNPVMAAYGASKNLEHEGEEANEAKPDEEHKSIPIEWDVWLDKEAPDDLSKVKIAHGKELATLLGQVPGIRSVMPKVAPSVKAGLGALGGDESWMATFGKAISMYRAGGKLPPDADQMEPKEQQEMLKKLAEVNDVNKMVDTAKEFTNKATGGGIVLDIKSTYSSAGDVAKFVGKLKENGIDVRIVGSFRTEQLGELNGGDREGEVRPVTFVHSIDGLESKVKGNELQPGDHVMFNAADLLKKAPGGGDDNWEENPDSLNRIAFLVEEKGLKVGLYVQETAAGPRAVRTVTKICNEHPNLFADGFAHGNVSGDTEENNTGSGMGSQKWPAMGEHASNKLKGDF